MTGSQPWDFTVGDTVSDCTLTEDGWVWNGRDEYLRRRRSANRANIAAIVLLWPFFALLWVTSTTFALIGKALDS